MSATPETQRAGVVMAGGSGERFWPLSRKHRPKQLLRLTSARQSMLEEAVSRLAPLIPPEHIYIVTGEHLVQPIQAAHVGIPGGNILAEPCKRNTSGALAYAAACLLARYGGHGDTISMAVTTADHQIGDPERFAATLDAALSAAERDPVLATLGVTPTRPDTGYGYIQSAGDALHGAGGHPVYRVRAFHEKPNQETAEDFLAAGNYYWNSGMFCWRVSTFLSELDAARPALAAAVRAMASALRQGNEAEVRSVFDGLENISIDYALMEHARRVVMVPADFPWDDVGAWTALDRTYPHDARGNVTSGDPILVDCRDSIVYNDPGADKMAVSVIGAENLVVVVTEDAVLVIPKDRAQDVRHAVEQLKKRGAGQV